MRHKATDSERRYRASERRYGIRKDIEMFNAKYVMDSYGMVCDKKCLETIIGMPDPYGNVVLGESPNTVTYNVLDCLFGLDLNYRYVPDQNLEIGWIVGEYPRITRKNTIKVGINETVYSQPQGTIM